MGHRSRLQSVELLDDVRAPVEPTPRAAVLGSDRTALR
jgi:hypothetical protein